MTEQTPIQMELPLPLLKQEPAPEIAATFVVRIYNNRLFVLLARRLRGEDRGHLTLPGGKIEPNESPLEAARRELRQETSWGVDPFFLIPAHLQPLVIRSPYGSHTFSTFFMYWDEATNSTPPQRTEKTKHSEWRWLTLGFIVTCALNREFPISLLQGPWRDEVNEALRLRVKKLYEGPIPAHILADCNLAFM